VPFEIKKMPGRDNTQFLVFDSPPGAGTPMWMISIDDILSSNIAGEALFMFLSEYSEYAQLFGFCIGVTRNVAEYAEDQLLSLSAVRHDDCVVYIPLGGYVATLEDLMYTGTVVNYVTIEGLGWYDGKFKPFTLIELEGSYIVEMTYDLDRVFIRFRVSTLTTTYFAYDHQGKAGGQAVCTVDLTSNSSSQS
jgi:hypothetical protein